MNQLSMQTRTYSICRTCAAVFPSDMRCATCAGDQRAAAAVAAATAQAALTGRAAPYQPVGVMRLATTLLAATLLAGICTALIATLATL